MVLQDGVRVTVVQRVIRCDCGFEASAVTDDELVTKAQGHARRVHDVELAAELILALARPQPTRSDGPE